MDQKSKRMMIIRLISLLLMLIAILIMTCN